MGNRVLPPPSHDPSELLILLGSLYPFVGRVAERQNSGELFDVGTGACLGFRCRFGGVRSACLHQTSNFFCPTS